MKNVKRLVICVAMLMASVNLMAQLTFEGTISDFPTGGSSPVTVTFQTNGDFVFDVKGSQTVTPFKIKGNVPRYLVFYMPSSSGEKGLKGNGAQWVLQVSEWSDFEVNHGSKGKMKFTSSKEKIAGSIIGQTGEKDVQLKVMLNNLIEGQKSRVMMECTLKR